MRALNCDTTSCTCEEEGWWWCCEEESSLLPWDTVDPRWWALMGRGASGRPGRRTGRSGEQLPPTLPTPPPPTPVRRRLASQLRLRPRWLSLPGFRDIIASPFFCFAAHANPFLSLFPSPSFFCSPKA
eukprot:Rhum_TRINITY_DN7312_c0_g1::Rhum_TRINITY_DN7312_c0_g1_i1::g.22519::m.22519